MNLELGRTGRERELSASWTRADRERLDRRIELFQNGMRLKSCDLTGASTCTEVCPDNPIQDRGCYNFARFTRESVDRIGKLVRSLKWAWGLSHGDEFRAKRDEFISTVVPSLYSFQCVPVLE
ncbi:hypothetical protein F2Q70_00026527 [Brassica cretica]|uniref:Uncharacterized protein n=1 Tax=Brassica cretica TaxID=69181 RepID=A0A8S9LF79_BRACR|nr:hypothetical protein F2Q70_00026527 [Brassica cretica]